MDKKASTDCEHFPVESCTPAVKEVWVGDTNRKQSVLSKQIPRKIINFYLDFICYFCDEGGGAGGSTLCMVKS